ESPRCCWSALTVHAQRTAGNRAVVAMLGAGQRYDTRPTVPAATLLNLQRHARNAAAARVRQRAPAFGLATPQATNEFAKTAVMWWRKYPGTTLDNFAFIMVEEASRWLEKIGVPAGEPERRPSATAGGLL